MPTLGPLYPASAPDISNGEAIFTEKCIACHGPKGLGDGEQGKQLPVTVAPLGLAEFAQDKTPSTWYSTVTQGNLERFMPPFASLNDQQRWDVIAYVLTLHTTSDQIEKGKSLFEADCAECAKNFTNPEMMFGLSENDLVKIIKEGKGDIPAFGKGYSDDDARAVAMYLRTLTFASVLPTPTAVPATATPVSAETSGTPSAETTPVDGTQVSGTPEAATTGITGKVSGSFDNQTGKALPSDLKVTVRRYKHEGDPTEGPTETGNFEAPVNADGTFVLEGMELPENEIYIAELKLDGLTYKSEFAVVNAGMTEITLNPVVLHASTTDYSALKIESVHIFFDFANADVAQIFAVYTISNTGDKTVIVNTSDTQVIPFIASPEGADGLGYEATQDSAPFEPTDNGFAMPPSETPYGLIAFASLPKQDKISVSQPALLPIGGFNLFLPEGMKAEGTTLEDKGLQPIQSTNFQVYSAAGLDKGQSLEFTVSGKPAEPVTDNPDVTQNKTLLIGVGAFGIVLILAGVWMFMRDPRKREEDAEDEGDEEFEDEESILDAIITLDDLHRAGKIPDEAYQQRRAELKSALKRQK
jgi:mono/diheme cytochrome c family protein